LLEGLGEEEEEEKEEKEEKTSYRVHGWKATDTLMP
jgi:hypothetical protein